MFMHRKVPFTLILLLAFLVSMLPANMAQAQLPETTPPVNPDTTTTTTAPAGQVDKPADNPGQVLDAGSDAVSGYYQFSSFAGAYTEIAGGVQVTTSCDDTNYGTYPLDFSFTYDGAVYTSFGIQCNGFIAMGALPSSSYTPISSGATNNVIVAIGEDQQTNLTDSGIRYETLGTAPNRVLVVQWKNFRHYNVTGEIYNYQIRLYETSNLVEVVYGPFTKNTTNRTVQVGLRGASNADFNNRTTTTDWSASTAGTLNTATMALTTAVYPAGGLTYNWLHTPGPIFNTSLKQAVDTVIVGDPLEYVISIVNSGDMDAFPTVMTDTLPTGTVYVAGSVVCTTGVCMYDSGSNSILWTGDVAIGATQQVTFSVDTDGVLCGSTILNIAQILHPATGKTASPSATTLAVSTLPSITYGFEPTDWPPIGWTTGIITDTGTDPVWSRVTVGTYPTISPHSGGAMAKFNSYNSSSGSAAHLTTPALDLTALIAPSVFFYMTHDTGYSANADRIQVQVSTDGGGTWTNEGAPILRYDAAYTVAGWGWHSVDLSAYAGINGVNVRFLAISAYGNNLFLDDVVIAETWYPCPAATLAPDQAGMGCRASEVTYNLTAGTNFMGDTYDVGVTGNTWSTVAFPTTLDLLDFGTAPVTVTVQIPWDAVIGSTDVATIDIAGQTYGLSDSAMLTTMAVDAFQAASWQDLTPTPSLFWGASYYENGNVCVVGGLTGSTPVPSNAHDCYDISTGTWFTRALEPTTTFGSAYGFIDGKFYVAGGFIDGAFTGTTLVQIYDPGTDTWDTATGAPLPSARGGQAGGVVDGKLYSAGGAPTSSFPTDCPTYEYDPVANSWATKAACPLQSTYGFDLGGSVGSNFHHRLFAGGHFNSTYGWYAYDPVADAWQTLANLSAHKTPLMVEDPGTGLIYQVGGLISWAGVTTVSAYDYATDSWDTSPADLPTAIGGSLGPPQGSFGDPDVEGLWMVGGTVGSGSLNPFRLLEFTVCQVLVPDIVVTPDALSAEQCADTVTDQTLQVCNNGNAPLDWALTEVIPTVKLVDRDVTVTVPAIPVPDETIASRSQPVALPERKFSMHIDELSLVDINVLIVTPDVVGGGDISLLLNTLAAFPDLIVTVWDGNAGTPTVADMQAYDVVFVGNDILWTSSAIDKTVLSNNLADYVDAGGKVLVGSFIWSYDDWGFGGGRFITDDYSPFEIATSDIWDPTTLGAFDPAHPIMAGITSITDAYNHQDQVLSSTGTWVASWADGENFVGVSPNVVGLNQLYFHSASFGGQVGELLHNALLYLTAAPAEDIPWLSEDPISGSILPGVCQDITVSFDSTGLAWGDYFGELLLTSNDPDQPEISVPVTLTVDESVDIVDVAFTTVDLTAAFTPTVSGLEPIDYMWDFGDGITSTETNPIHTYAAGGIYNVMLNVANDCAVDMWTGEVTVCDPAHDADFIWSPPTPMDGETVYFTATVLGTGPFTFEWDFGDGGTGSGQYPTHAYAAAGIYAVVLAVTGECGEALVVTYDITVTASCVLPDGADFVWAPVDPLVAESIAFSGTLETGSGPLTWEWDFGDDSTAAGQYATHAYAAAGTYTVTLTVSNDCGTTTVSYEITVTSPVITYTMYIPMTYKDYLP
jgi:uncharacterized repeat protein (TIGR01451 family)